MKILVVAATLSEVERIYQHFNLPPEAFVQTPKFDLLITGVGMTATAFSLGQHLHKGYQLILNLGIAGCFDTSIPLGSVLNIVADEFAELGAEDNESFLSITQLGFGKNKYQCSYNGITTEVSLLPAVNGITVNKVHGYVPSIVAIKQRLNPTTESMEGAAVFYAAEKTGTPCLQIRSVSNYVEARNKASWKIGLAVKNLHEWAIQYLTNA
jgi:futalosine hydrolase